MKILLKRVVAVLIAAAMITPAAYVGAEDASTGGDLCTDGGVHEYKYTMVDEITHRCVCDACGATKTENHKIQSVGLKKPLFTENGWKAYEICTLEGCSYSTFEAIKAMGEPEITSYDEFVENLIKLEEIAHDYVKANPGNDPLELMIKYIRTGVDRYNSGSWGIMAGYENADFANYVRRYENSVNQEASKFYEELLGGEMTLEEYYEFVESGFSVEVDNGEGELVSVDLKFLRVTGLKNIENFYLPNGDYVDLGHMFGTMDISYTNKASENHADVGGWAGDLVDLITSADKSEVSGTIEEMVAVLKEEHFLKNPHPNDVFSLTDFYGDLDAYYVLKTVLDRGYSYDVMEGGTLAQVVMEYFTENLTTTDRAKYFLKNRLGNAGTREQVRRAVYNTYTGNKTIATLEATRPFVTSQDNINSLRKAACYVFADYICSLAGDYIEIESNPYYAEFNTEATNLAPGVIQETHYATTADGKQIVYYTATADLSNPDVTVYANYNENDPNLGWHMSRVLDQANAAQNKYGNPESAEYIENYQVVAAINADGFDMATGEPSGLLVMNGTEYHPINGSGFFGITKEGKAVIGTTEEYNSTYKGQLRDGVSAFGTTLVKDGKITVSKRENYQADRASRTAIGITKTGKVVFMVLDGRQEPRSCGGSPEEIAQIMLEAGCYTAVNLDGGGSTTFVSKPEGKDALEVTSKPSDGYARSVSNSLMIVSTAPSSTKFDHARLDSDYSYVTVGTPLTITPVGLSATGNTVALPENCTWEVATNKNYATVSVDGVFTATQARTFEIHLLSGDEIIGQKTINVVRPDNVYFKKKAVDAVYGSQIDIPVAAVYDGNPVAINESDVVLSVSPVSAGTFNGYKFNVAESSAAKVATITGTLKNNSGITSTISVNLYNQGENTFDFDKATGGDRQFAWDRQVTNTVTEDAVTYIAENPNEDMTTSYIFAIDMREIPIPVQLEDLLYMLPGADTDGDQIVDGDVSAWRFLLQLAERVSVLTEVKPVLKFDSRFEVDASEVEVINDYFTLHSSELDEEKNELTLTLKWVDRTASIDIEDANPLCMLKGIKLTPKDGAWSSTEKINAVHNGEVGYKIYLRANALYSFSNKEENQEVFNLYPFTNAFTNPSGEEQYEAGGYFEDIYKTFEDHYTLSLAKKNGWVNEDGGFAYYVDGVRLTGVAFADGFYYDFGEEGVNAGQEKYTGFFEEDGKTYYVLLGELIKGKWQLVGDAMYHCHEAGDVYTTEVYNPVTCTKGGRIKYTCNQCGVSENSASFIMPTGHDCGEGGTVCFVCGTVLKDISTAIIDFGTVDNPRNKDYTPEYDQRPGGFRPITFVSFDGKTELIKSNDAHVNEDDGTMKDVYQYWENDKGIGKAYVNYEGKGDYYGTGRLEYILVPAGATNLVATPGMNSVTLSWSKAAGADYYVVYKKNANGSRGSKLGETTSISYTIEGLSPETQYSFRIVSMATSTDGENKLYESDKYADVTVTTNPLPDSSEFLSAIKVVEDGNKIAMITKGGVNYIMLPSHADLKELKLEYVANSSVSGQQVTVSGNLRSANSTTFDMDEVASKNGDFYDVKVAVGNHKPMEIRFMQGANIPSMFIISDDANKGREYVDKIKGNKATASMQMVDNSGEIVYNGSLTEIKARGNSTFTYYDKKSYQIKLGTKTDLVGNDEDVKTWVLLANYGDATMMHDKFMKDLASDLGMDYVADSNWVNLWYDGEYRGIYLVSEKNSVGSTSVDITDMEEAYEDANPGYGNNMTAVEGTNKYGHKIKYTEGLTDPADITGGYLVELNLDRIDEASGFITRRGKGFNIKSPEWLSEDAVCYISEYYQEFEDAVYAVNSKGEYTGYNLESGKFFYEYVDLDSLVKMFIMQEIGINPDGFISSLYFHKDANGIMYVGPIWDQDMTLGTGWSKYIDAKSTKNYHYLAEALINIPAFKARLAEIFEEDAAALIDEAIAEGGKIDSHYDRLSQNAKMNYILWPYVRVGKPEATGHIWENADYELVVEDMKDWLSARLEILDKRFIPRLEAGDVSGDGKVNSVDAVLILRSIVGYKDAEFNADYGDVSGDGKVNSIDAVLILRKLVGLE